MLLSNAQSWFSQESTVQPCKYMNGSAAWGIGLASMASTNDNCSYSGTGSNAYYVIIGAGDTPVDFNDYDMADSSVLGTGKMISSNQTAAWVKETGDTLTTTWTNTSDAAITIKEVGVAFKNSSTANSKGANILVSRQLLSTPVTIQPNESYVFSYTISVK